MSPTERTLRECRRLGWTCAVVEKWNPHARIRQDLFGFIDLIVLDGSGAIGVQATSGSNATDRIRKIVQEPRARIWIENGLRIEVWFWRKLKLKRGGLKYKWELDRRPVTIEDIEAGVPPEPVEVPPPHEFELPFDEQN